MNQTVKIIKLINGDDIVTVLPTGEKQLPDNGPLLRLDKPLQIKYVPQMTPTGFQRLYCFDSLDKLYWR